MHRYTSDELFALARPLLTGAVDDTKVRDWADGVVSGSTRNFSELCGLCRITGPTVRTLHRKLAARNPEIPSMFPRVFPRTQRFDGKTQSEAIRDLRTEQPVTESEGLHDAGRPSHRDLFREGCGTHLPAHATLDR